MLLYTERTDKENFNDGWPLQKLFLWNTMDTQQYSFMF